MYAILLQENKDEDFLFLTVNKKLNHYVIGGRWQKRAKTGMCYISHCEGQAASWYNRLT